MSIRCGQRFLFNTNTNKHLAAKLVPVNHARESQWLFWVEGREGVDVVVQEHVVVVAEHDEPLLRRVGLQHQAQADEGLAQRAEVVVLLDAGI